MHKRIFEDVELNRSFVEPVRICISHHIDISSPGQEIKEEESDVLLFYRKICSLYVLLMITPPPCPLSSSPSLLSSLLKCIVSCCILLHCKVQGKQPYRTANLVQSGDQHLHKYRVGSNT